MTGSRMMQNLPDSGGRPVQAAFPGDFRVRAFFASAVFRHGN
jgi:hypothetical protein